MQLDVPRLHVEPGRAIVGEAGTTLYTVGGIKDVPGIRTYVAVDGGISDNPRRFFDLTSARTLLGYEPEDRAPA